MQILDIIKGRRSVRKYKKKKVPEASLYYVLEAARWAPSSANIQNWRFIIIEDEAAKMQIAKATLEQEWIAEAPLLIVVCSLTEKVKSKFPRFGEIYSIQNTSAAIENMLIAAMGVGLATCWVTAFAHNRVRRVCDIPDKVDVHGIVTLGYASERPVAVSRHDVYDLTYFGEWDTKILDKHEYIKGQDVVPLLERKFVKNAANKIKNAGRRLTPKRRAKRRK